MTALSVNQARAAGISIRLTAATIPVTAVVTSSLADIGFSSLQAFTPGYIRTAIQKDRVPPLAGIGDARLPIVSRIRRRWATAAPIHLLQNVQLFGSGLSSLNAAPTNPTGLITIATNSCIGS